MGKQWKHNWLQASSMSSASLQNLILMRMIQINAQVSIYKHVSKKDIFSLLFDFQTKNEKLNYCLVKL